MSFAWRMGVLALAVAAPACIGNIGDADRDGNGPGANDPSTCADCGPGVTIRRLTRAEYDRTVRDLFGIEGRWSQGFPAEETVDGWDNNAEALTFSPLLADQALQAATTLGVVAVDQRERFEPCTADAPDGDCVARWVDAFGLAAWRRPLTDEERARLLAIYDAGAGDGFARGLELVARTVLVSLPFHYRIESAEGVVDEATGRRRPDGFAMASRLSYLIWGSRPDDRLLERAAAGELITDEAVEAEARRMLADPRALDVAVDFFERWSWIAPAATTAKSPDVFPEWQVEYAELLYEGARRFYRHVAEAGTFRDLYTSSTFPVNGALAPYYGVTVEGDDWVMVDTGPERQGGFITQGALLIAHAGFETSSPTLRGHAIRAQMLCGHLPDPPETVDVNIGPAGPDTTTREQIEQHSADPSCAGCHRLMDPIGFALEGFDAAGWPRSEENGQPIDASGEALDTDMPPFEGAEGLGRALMESVDARSCFARQWFRYAFGRDGDEADAEDLTRLVDTLAPSGRVEDVVITLVRSDAFRFLPEAE